MPNSPRHSTHHGFTLLEVILALSLTAVVLLIVVTGIGLQLRSFDRGRARIERAQLARVLLHRMADDLRGLIPPQHPAGDTAPPSTAGTPATESSASDSSSASPASADSAASAESMLAELSGGAPGDDMDELLAEGDAALSPPAPGIYGEVDWLRIDVLQATPRGSNSNETADEAVEQAPQTPREIKTVVYYVVTPDAVTTQTLSTDTDQPQGGLVRRELVRPVVSYASVLGDFEYQDPSVTPLASEVTAIEFRYHDGTDWLEAWDTDEMGDLPKAIEIRLFLSPIPTLGSTAAESATDTNEAPDIEYRLVLRVPFHEIDDTVGQDSLDSTSTEEGTSEAGDAGNTSDSSGGTGR